LPGSHVAFVGEAAQDLLDGVGVEAARGPLEAVGQRRQQFARVVVPALLDGLLFVLVGIFEKERPVGGEVAGEGDAILHHGGHVGEVVVGGRVARGFERVAAARGDRLGREAVQVLLVEPLQLVEVELRAGPRHTLQAEGVDQLVERKDLFFSTGIPAQQRDEVHERLRLVPLLSVVAHGDGKALFLGVALRELAPIRAHDERQVGHRRHVPAERLVEQLVLGRGREPLLPANDVRDAHFVVVDDVGEVIRRQAVAFEEHLVVEVVRAERNGPAHFVGKLDARVTRHV